MVLLTQWNGGLENNCNHKDTSREVIFNFILSLLKILNSSCSKRDSCISQQ